MKNKLTQGFTLIELIVVVIIIGILVSVSLTQYSNIAERARLAEAKTRIGVMRDLAYQYFLEHGSLATIEDIDIGVDNLCSSESFYKYHINLSGNDMVGLAATRCTSGGKPPNTTKEYIFDMSFHPSTGHSSWSCTYVSGPNADCFGYPAGF